MLAIACAIAAASFAVSAAAQSWAYLDVANETSLVFERSSQGAGSVQVDRTSPDAAKFKITGSVPGAGTGQPVVRVTLYPPESLIGPGGGQTPYSMMASYNSVADDQATATTFNSNSVNIPLQILEGYGGGGQGHFSAYVYVHGVCMVGNVPVGDYTGDITLAAEQNDPSGGTGTEGCEVAWDPSVWYNTGDWVESDGRGWRALWWNAGNEPGSDGSSSPWEDMGPCGAPTEGIECDAPAWTSTKIYQANDWATFDGSAWQALYYTRGDGPASGGPWQEMGPCDGTPWDGTGCASLPWMQTHVYDDGDEVTYGGFVWRARNYSRGDTPGSAYVWEQIASCG